MKNFKILFYLIIFFFMAIGLFMRLAPLFDDYRLQNDIIDDGYYMITIGRNIAMGYGISVSDGTIQTNGIQPLYTFVIAGASKLVNCDKILTLKLVVIIQLLISLLTFWVIWKMGKSFFTERENSSQISLFAAALWFASPLTILNTINGLESALYNLSTLLFIWFFIFKIKKLNYLTSIFLGFSLGIIFWIRNDAVFLIAIVCIFIILYKFYDKNKIYPNVIHAVIIGIVSVITALPWLIYNTKFGSIIPLSGYAELSRPGADLIYKYVPAVYVEYFILFYSIPILVKVKTIVIIITTLLSLVIFFLLFKNYKHFTENQKKVFFITIAFMFSLSIFYGVYFKTYYFLSRYLFPISPFICLLLAAFIFKIFEKPGFKAIKYTIAGLFFIYFAAISYRNYQHNYQWNFTYFVDWVEKNVRKDEWVWRYSERHDWIFP